MFPHCTLKGYEIRSRKDRDKYGGGLIEFAKNGFICKTIPAYTSDLNTRTLSPSMKPTLTWWGGLSNQEVSPGPSTRRTGRSNATTFDKGKQTFFMLIPRIWFKVEEFRQISLFIFSIFSSLAGFELRPTYILYQYIPSFRVPNIISFFSSLSVSWSFVFGGEIMTFSDTEMKELGRSTWTVKIWVNTD